MTESGLLGLYWGVRQAPLEECGRAAYETLRALHALGYERYFFLGRSRRDALKRQLTLTEKDVTAALGKGVNRNDERPRRPIVDLGWSLWLWSGDTDDESYAIHIQCGCYCEYVRNAVVMDLPAEGRFSLHASAERALKAYEALLEIWNPEQAVLCEGLIDWVEGKLVPAGKALAQRLPAP